MCSDSGVGGTGGAGRGGNGAAAVATGSGAAAVAADVGGEAGEPTAIGCYSTLYQPHYLVPTTLPRPVSVALPTLRQPDCISCAAVEREGQEDKGFV